MGFQNYEKFTFCYFEYKKEDDVVRGVHMPNWLPGNLDSLNPMAVFWDPCRVPNYLVLVTKLAPSALAGVGLSLDPEGRLR